MANAKLIAHIVQVRIGRIANLQHLIQPCQIPIAAATDATSTVNSDVIPNSYKEARASIEAAGWQQSMDEEMTNIRKLGC